MEEENNEASSIFYYGEGSFERDVVDWDSPPTYDDYPKEYTQEDKIMFDKQHNQEEPPHVVQEKEIQPPAVHQEEEYYDFIRIDEILSNFLGDEVNITLGRENVLGPIWEASSNENQR